MIDGHIIAGIAYSMVPLRVNLKAMYLSICLPDSRAQGVPCNDQLLKQTQFSITVDTPCVRLSDARFSVLDVDVVLGGRVDQISRRYAESVCNLHGCFE